MKQNISNSVSTGKAVNKKTLLGTNALNTLSGKRCMISWSGGKDSCLAMDRAVQAGAKVEVIVNMKIEGGERSRSHGLRSGIIEAQAKALGARLVSAATSWEDYEANFIRILQKLSKDGIEAGIFGDIDLQPHLEWEEKVCREANLIPVLPIWKGNRQELVHEFINSGFKTHIVAVRADSLSPDYLGRIFTIELAQEFETQNIDICGENGEFHTVVVDGPLFRQNIEIIPGERVKKAGLWFLDYEVATG